MQTHGFDGLSFDWQYPVCWQSDCSKGNPAEKEGFATLITKLSDAFSSQGLTLAVSVAGYPAVIEKAYDLKSIGAAADMVSVMTYDYRGFWDGKTGHHAPVSAAEEVLALVAGAGVPKDKINVGLPMYGQSFTLSSSDNSVGASASGRGKAGPFTKQAGMMAFYEICSGGKIFKTLMSKTVKD